MTGGSVSRSLPLLRAPARPLESTPPSVAWREARYSQRTHLTMIFLQANWILAFVCAFVLYGAGKAEAREAGRNAGALWAGLSIAVSAVLIRFLGAGWILVLVGQAALFVGIGVFRAMRSK